MDRIINPNTASMELLLEIKGIGETKAKAVQDYVAKGGEINSVEEFQALVKMREVELEAIRDKLVFAEAKPDLSLPTLPSIPTIPDLEILPELLSMFSFGVQVSGAGEGDTLLSGYRLMVKYTTFALSSRIPSSHELSFKLPATGRLPVSISYVSKTKLSPDMRFMLLSGKGEVVYDAQHAVSEGVKVAIRLDTSEPQTLLINLKKQPTQSYTGYKLKLTAKPEKGALGSDKQVSLHDIGLSDMLDVTFDGAARIASIEVAIFSDTGMNILTEQHAWSQLAALGEARQLDLELPHPYHLSYLLQVIDDPDDYVNPYKDHLALVHYSVLGSGGSGAQHQVEKCYGINGKGQAQIDIVDYGVVTRMTLKIKAPSGEIIGQRELAPSEIGSDGIVEVKVPARQLANMEGIETLPERAKKIAGRVIDIKGAKKFEGVQVIIYATRAEEPSEEDYDPIIIAATEAQGYFITDAPRAYYQDAYAKIGVPPKGNYVGEVHTVPVRLELDQVLMVKDGVPSIEQRLFLPANLVLVIDTESEDAEEADPNGCKVDFHRKRMVVDEFSYFTVVRTTEPNIQGYTLEEDGEMTVQEVIDIASIEAGQDDAKSLIPLDYRSLSINKAVLLKHINDKKGLTLTTLQKAINESNAKKLRDAIKPQRQVHALGRHTLDLDHAIDWDQDPTIYQATTLAHGHLLHFKQEWRNNGYSLGDLLYSLPLAPGQKKQIVVFDWDRKEAAGRRESIDYEEGLYNSLVRDRDINEIVTGTLTESAKGGSRAGSSSMSGGFGLGAVIGKVGGLLGISGGSSKASSSAWQNSSRNTSLNDLQSLRDRTMQSANAVRSQRGTVIQTASQGETFTAETESVANYNHCHSMTIQYFEVLRHMQAEQRLSSVQECLFVPLMLTPFDFQKILRWREDLYRYVPSSWLRKGFDAIERIDNDYEGSNMPEGSYAEETIEHLEGHLYLKFDIPSPIDLEKLEEENEIIDLLSRFAWFFPGIDRHYAEFYEAERNKRNALFQRYVAPEIAAALVENLEVRAVISVGYNNEGTILLPMDTTLVSSFRNGGTHQVTLRQAGAMPSIQRKSIRAIMIKKAAQIIVENGSNKSVADLLPANSRVRVTSGALHYRTDFSAAALFSKSGIQDDLIGYATAHGDSEFVRIDTPLSRAELRRPRDEDLERANALQDHLNDNLEFFHKAIWMNISAERRFMFLDGIQVTDYSDANYPQGVVRSVASVVENKVIGIVGNSLVLPVAPGFRLDPNTRGADVDLHALYQPTTPIEPIHIAIPTKGVFAEAVMGSCNSCEKIEENRFWKWEEHPIPDSPTDFSTISTDSRRSTPLDTTPSTLANPVVNIQNAPAAPDPTGLATTANLLANSSFENLTGLAGNQQNAIEALKASFATTEAFGSKAAELATLGAKIQAIKDARESGIIDDETARTRTNQALNTDSQRYQDAMQGALSQIRDINGMVARGEISEADGASLKAKAIESVDPGRGSLVDNPAVQARIGDANAIEISRGEESVSLSAAEVAPAAASDNLQRFLVHFAKPKIFKDKGGARLDYGGHFGFDSLEDEYIHPMTHIVADNNGSAVNAMKPLCKNIAGLKQTYLDGSDETITPYGVDYYPAWLAIFPYTTEEEFAHGSSMHKNGANLSLEIQEVDTLVRNANEIRFETSSPHLRLSRTRIPMSEILAGRKVERVLDASINLKKTVYILEDAVNVTCSGGVLSEHTAIDVIAKGDDKEEKVGKLMVYANDEIPKAEIVLVKLRLDAETPALTSPFHYTLKNRSFNQALVRAEIVADELFDLTAHSAEVDVASFLTTYKGKPVANVSQFVDDIKALYEKYGAHCPGGSIDASTRTFMFLTELDAGTISGSSDLESATIIDQIEMFFRGAAIESIVWSNFMVVFNDGLTSQRTFIHELGHTFSLYHPFQEGNYVPGIFYQGTTDKVMDYTWRVAGGAPGSLTSAGSNPYYPSAARSHMWRFFKYEWDRIRADRSMITDY